jgi:hypothetical protein
MPKGNEQTWPTTKQAPYTPRGCVWSLFLLGYAISCLPKKDAELRGIDLIFNALAD